MIFGRISYIYNISHDIRTQSFDLNGYILLTKKLQPPIKINYLKEVHLLKGYFNVIQAKER